jgi:hypothetical protein
MVLFFYLTAPSSVFQYNYLTYALGRTSRQPTAALLRLCFLTATEKLDIINLCSAHDETSD